MIKDKMELGVLFSGGKDSCLALHKSIQEGHRINYLLSIIPENFDSFMFHKPYLNLLKKQAEVLGLKDRLLIQRSIGKEEEELKDLKLLLEKVKGKIDGIVVGGIASNYQGNRIRKICDKLKLKFYAPLWSYSRDDLWKELFKEKFEIVITKISCEGIPKEFLGGIINRKRFEELKKLAGENKFRIDFEGGEAETAVLYMPEFKKHIKIRFNIINEGAYRYYLDIKEVNLVK